MDLASVASYRLARSRADLALAPGETYVAGGTWLFSEPQPAVTGLVDLAPLGWAPVAALPDGGVSIAATCTIEQLQTHPWPASVAALVRQCCDALLMSFKVQHTATIGGNHALSLPAAATVSLTSALAAEVVLWHADGAERRVPVVDFVVGAGRTVRAAGETIRAIEVPAASLTARYAFRRISLTDLGRSSAVVIARQDPDAVVVTITAATPRPTVLRLPPGASPAQVAAAVATVPEWFGDPHGAVDWRRAQTERMALEAVAELAGEASR
ncbi:FAD binding domain-containing protein [Nocardioides sp.]|uniref:FAD binding domain-containing protein n=1 Tax=Nocardioides sp. TaxID=35761 RepID=UPI0039E5D961